MKIKCHDCGAEITAKYDPENGPYEEVRANTVGWCPPCQAKLDAEYENRRACLDCGKRLLRLYLGRCRQCEARRLKGGDK